MSRAQLNVEGFIVVRCGVDPMEMAGIRSSVDALDIGGAGTRTSFHWPGVERSSILCAKNYFTMG